MAKRDSPTSVRSRRPPISRCRRSGAARARRQAGRQELPAESRLDQISPTRTSRRSLEHYRCWTATPTFDAWFHRSTRARSSGPTTRARSSSIQSSSSATSGLRRRLGPATVEPSCSPGEAYAASRRARRRVSQQPPAARRTSPSRRPSPSARAQRVTVLGPSTSKTPLDTSVSVPQADASAS